MFEDRTSSGNDWRREGAGRQAEEGCQAWREGVNLIIAQTCNSSRINKQFSRQSPSHRKRLSAWDGCGQRPQVAAQQHRGSGGSGGGAVKARNNIEDRCEKKYVKLNIDIQNARLHTSRRLPPDGPGLLRWARVASPGQSRYGEKDWSNNR